jgi:hypothetical protein
MARGKAPLNAPDGSDPIDLALLRLDGRVVIAGSPEHLEAITEAISDEWVAAMVTEAPTQPRAV